MNAPSKVDFAQYRRYFTTLETTVQKPKVRAYTTSILSLLSVSLFGWFAIKPTIQTILYLRREIADKQVINQQMEEKITSLIEAQAGYQKAQPSLLFLKQATPTDPELLELLLQFKHLAANVGVTIDTVQLPTAPLLGQESTQSADETQAPLPIQLSVNGNYVAIKSFIEGLLNMRRIAMVDSMKLSKNTSSNPIQGLSAQSIIDILKDPPIQLDLGLTAYYRTQ